MNEQKAREILKDFIDSDGGLCEGAWCPGDIIIDLYDAHFNADILEAMAWWMRNTGKKERA